MLLSYEVISEADHARMANPARTYPSRWPADGTRATLMDGDELELLTRTSGYDPDLRCQVLEIRARLWRGDRLVREEAGNLRCAYYVPDRLREMLVDAGFVDVVVGGPYTGRPPEPSDDTVVVVARRVT